MPVYLAAEGRAVLAMWPAVTAAIIGVVAGTIVGSRILARVPEPGFRRFVGTRL